MTKVVVSVHYLAMKIFTVNEVITIKGDQQSAWGCYLVVSKMSYQIASEIHVKGYLTSSFQ